MNRTLVLGLAGLLSASAGATMLPASAEHRLTLPANTPILLAVDDTVSSQRLRQGSRFGLSVVNDVVLDGVIVVPAGTHAEAQLSWRTGRGAFGKSGKMEFDLVNLALGGQALPLSGHYRVEGHGDTWGMLATALLVAWPGIFITGHSAHIQSGTEFRALTRAPMEFAVRAPETPLRQAAYRSVVQHPGRIVPTMVVQTYPGRSNGYDDAIEVPM